MPRGNERLGDGLTREHVRWAYRLFLDREPESEDVLDLPAMDTSALRHAFPSSSEYQLTNSGVSTVGDKWVIVPTDLGFRIFVNPKGTRNLPAHSYGRL